MLGVGALHRAMEGKKLKRIFKGERGKGNVVVVHIKLLLKKATQMTIMSTFCFPDPGQMWVDQFV